MSAGARANGWQGFDNIGNPVPGGYEYICDGMPRLMGCGASTIITRKFARVGLKKSGWLVCYGMEPKPGSLGRFAVEDDWEEDKDVVLTFCPSCAKVVQEGQRKS